MVSEEIGVAYLNFFSSSEVEAHVKHVGYIYILYNMCVCTGLCLDLLKVKYVFICTR